jgi:hypothetical protein
MDFRLRCEMWKWMDAQKYTHDCDVVSLAGASKGIADGGEAEHVILQQIDVAYKLHEVRYVILLHHSDCGAYHASYDFKAEAEKDESAQADGWADKEKEKQLEDMKKAKQIIEDRYLGIEVVLVWGQLKDEGGEEIEFSTI